MEEASLMLEVEEGDERFDWSTTQVKTEPVDDETGFPNDSFTANGHNVEPTGSLHQFSQESSSSSSHSHGFVNDGHRLIQNIKTEPHADNPEFDHAEMEIKDQNEQHADDNVIGSLSGFQSVKQEPVDADWHDTNQELNAQYNNEVDYSALDPGADSTKTPYSCDICGRCYQHLSSLKTHKKKHVTGERSHVCGTCGKGFILRDGLLSHMRTHEEKTKHVCTICGLGFRQNSFLIYHLRVHTGEKPYQCSNCDSRFRTSNGLREHSRIHTGEKPYSCLICGQSFSQGGSLKSHLRTHTGEKPYKCEICNKAFSLSTTLTRHIKTHTKVEQFKCEICSKFLCSLKYLKCHMLKQHMIEEAS